MKKQLVLPQKLVDVFGGNNEEALRAFLLSLLTTKKEEFPLQNSSVVWEEAEKSGLFHGGDVRTIPKLWFELCLLSYSEKPLPQMLKLENVQLRFLCVFVASNNCRCFVFKTEKGKLSGTQSREEALVFVFSPFLPQNLYQEISLGFGTMCDTGIDPKSGIHSGILSVSSEFTKNIVSCISNQGVTPKIWLVGMSMGGAMAKACLWHIRETGWRGEAEVVTFGCPRVGNAKFCGWFKDNATKDSFSAVLVTNDERKIIADPVTLFPPKERGYEDCPFLWFLHNKVLFWSDWLRTTQSDLDITVSGCFRGLLNFEDIRKYGFSNMGIGERNREWELAHSPQAYFDNL
ncbi:conservedputative class 3 lipase [Melbournevirus]|uniref:conservedputative class 3 lipase n=1 Tax=Melbournevirus TaxID=1560514 RepID=UPI00051F5329|nr:conservedputative class 3 lipase [Melbournevirus]AIT54812.1 class 3 lipase [Melbournevirus]